MNRLTLGSLFDGSGGFPLAASMCEIESLWASEIEPFPILVTKKNLPKMRHLGDIRKINGSKIEPVDIITFGSPCTDLSVAGRRAGLEGKNSSLFHEAIRIIKEMRYATNGKSPRFIVFENVPGIFSSGKGSDFRNVLEEIAKIKNEAVSVPVPEKNKWLPAGEIVGENFSIAWRVLNAKFWGVPQRRSRVYLVADFRSECAGKILFESKGVRRNPQTSRSTGQNTPGNFKNCVGEAIAFEPGAASRLGGRVWQESTCALRARMGDNQVAIFENHPSDSRVKMTEDGVIQTLTHSMGSGGGKLPLVLTKPLTLKIRTGGGSGGKGPLVQNNMSSTLCCGNDQTLFETSCYCISGNLIGRKDKNGPNGTGVISENSYTLNTSDRHSVFYSSSYGGYGEGDFGTLTHSGGHLGGGSESFITKNKTVRKLTPLECCRLQGFPDYWCQNLDIKNPTNEEIQEWDLIFKNLGKQKSEKQITKWLKNPYSDSVQYKMWGNGVALPCVYFVIKNIKNHYENTS